MVKNLLLTMILLLILLTGCEEAFQPFVLADQQKPCTIVLDLGGKAAVSPEELERQLAAAPAGGAAIELRHYLARILSLPERAIPIADDDDPRPGRVILLGRPGSGSAWAAAARHIDKLWKRLPQDQMAACRFDAWQEEKHQIVAITTPAAQGNLLRAVYAFLDYHGVRWLFPGRAGENIEMRREIRVTQASYIPAENLPMTGFLPVCNEGTTADSTWLLWWARQRFTHVPLAWASDPQQLQTLGLQGVAAALSGLTLPGKSEICLNDPAQIEHLEHLLVATPRAGLVVLDAGRMAPLCGCERCAALGSLEDRWLELVRRLGMALAGGKKQGTIHPDARLLAIQEPALPQQFDSREWPRQEVVLAARMMPRCFNHALADPACVEVNSHRLAALGDWIHAHNFAQLGVVEGYYDPQFAGLPLVLDKIITTDLRLYHRLGLALFCEAPATARSGIQIYQNYLFSQAMHHATLNPDSLRRTWGAFAWPGAATMMGEYLAMQEEAFANVSAWRWELPLLVRQLEKRDFAGSLLPLERFNKHFTLYQQYADGNEGVAWERTFQLIHDARHVMDDMLEHQLPDQTLDRLLEAEMQLRFAELTVTFYDNVIRTLTLGEDEPEMREEAAIRLRQVVKKMTEFQTAGLPCGPANALQGSGLNGSAQALLARLQKRYGVPYTRVYQE